MTRKEFWEHIDKTRRKDADAHEERLVKRLAKLPVPQILDFCHLWDDAHGAAYTWNLWGAGYIINCGCSDDGFDYFRGWLMLKGRKVYEAAMKDADSLADVADPEEDFCEYEGRPGWNAWFAATGTPIEEEGYDALFAALDVRPHKSPPQRGMGRAWNFDDERKMLKRYPRLWALYNGGEGEE